jgi:hypothetical protein
MLLLTVTGIYLVILKKIFPSKHKFIEALKGFSIMEFVTVFSGRVFDENIKEALVGLVLVVTAFYLGIAYLIVEVVKF